MASFMFTPSSLRAKAGTLVFFLKNEGNGFDPASSQPHNLAIGPEVGHAIASSSYVLWGKSAIFTVDGLAAGSYAIWCSVPGHANNGMVGTLTVAP